MIPPMRKYTHLFQDRTRNIFFVIIFVLTASVVYLVVENLKYKKNISVLQNESENLKQDLQQVNEKYSNALNLLDSNEQDKKAVLESLNQIGLDYNNLMSKYNDSISEVNKLSRTIQIDDEVLKKYSKFYFLNENYTPAVLVEINSDLTENKKKISLIPEVKFRLEQMLNTAKNENVSILVNSGYRSFAEQQGLKSRYSQIFGVSKANQFSADQGYSEHQLGTTVDITDGKTGLEQNFEKTKTFLWLESNAYKYGFILSYPKNNKFYIYEPWHWRFVGLELAKYLHENKLNFYDLDQKLIDTYKAKVFN
jgi:D-alanyl-D-alanine carboxypeptidase